MPLELSFGDPMDSQHPTGPTFGCLVFYDLTNAHGYCKEVDVASLFSGECTTMMSQLATKNPFSWMA